LKKEGENINGRMNARVIGSIVTRADRKKKKRQREEKEKRKL